MPERSFRFGRRNGRGPEPGRNQDQEKTHNDPEDLPEASKQTYGETQSGIQTEQVKQENVPTLENPNTGGNEEKCGVDDQGERGQEVGC